MNTASEITLEDLRQLPLGEIAALPVGELARLQQEAYEAMRQAKQLNDLLDSAITRRYGDRVALIRHQINKPTGIIRFDDNPFTVVADLPKKPEWDQEQLAAIVGQIQEAGDNPLDYVEVSYRVPESRFNAWPATIRRAFEPARTLKVGKPTFKLERPMGRGGA